MEQLPQVEEGKEVEVEVVEEEEEEVVVVVGGGGGCAFGFAPDASSSTAA